MSMGDQTVTIRKRVNGATRDRLNQPMQTVSDSAWPDVLMQHKSTTEKVTTSDVAVQIWHCTGDPTEAAVAAVVNDELVYAGRVYQITEARMVHDFAGPHHVRIGCQYQED